MYVSVIPRFILSNFIALDLFSHLLFWSTGMFIIEVSTPRLFVCMWLPEPTLPFFQKDYFSLVLYLFFVLILMGSSYPSTSEKAPWSFLSMWYSDFYSYCEFVSLCFYFPPVLFSRRCPPFTNPPRFDCWLAHPKNNKYWPSTLCSVRDENLNKHLVGLFPQSANVIFSSSFFWGAKSYTIKIWKPYSDGL